MISLSNSEKLLEAVHPLYSPYEYDDALVLACHNGEVLKFSDGQLKAEFKIQGQINCVVYDPTKQTYYAGDMVSKSILGFKVDEQNLFTIVKDYENVPFLGPYAMILSKKTGNIIFTDCGRIDQTNQSNTKGSIFMIDMHEQSIIKPLALNCLELPTGLSYSNTENIFYVCETGKNRVLRFFENSDGVYYQSVFYQFAGRYGPTAITVSNSGFIFVGIFEFKSVSAEGFVNVLNPGGELLSKLKLNHTGPEISGLFFSRTSNNNVMLFMTENSSKPSCFRLLIEVAKKEEKKQGLSYRELLK